MEDQHRSNSLIAQQNAAKSWPNFPYDILLHILSMMSLVDRLVTAAGVCKSWRTAAFELLVSSKNLDLSGWSDPLSRDQRAALNLAFIRGINLSRGSLRALTFNPFLLLKVKHLLYASSRCTNLKELVLPGFFSNISEEGLGRIFRKFSQLESLTLGRDHTRFDLFGAIGKSCPNLMVLDTCCPSLRSMMAVGILHSMPRLKVLKVRCRFNSEDLENWTNKLMIGLPELEEISVSVNGQMISDSTRSSKSEPWVTRV